MTVMNTPPMAFSWVTLAAMLTVLGASVLMFLVLVRQWTSRRQWISLAQWARESGFRLRLPSRSALPPDLLLVLRDESRIRFCLSAPRTTLMQFVLDSDHSDTGLRRANVLIRPRIPPGPQAGLRPAGQKSSLIDLLPLSQFASLTLGERFVVHALDSSAARNLADAPILGLLPPDVGLILLENEILLEFSSRPFDPIEFGRMIGLADQVAAVV